MNTNQNKITAIQSIIGTLKTNITALGTFNMVSTDYADLGKAGAYPNCIIKLLDIVPESVRETGDWECFIMIILQTKTTDDLTNLTNSKGVLNLLENYRFGTGNIGGEITNISSVFENTGTSRTGLIEIEYKFCI